MNQTLDILREATKGSRYDGRLYLVGGIVRDRFLEDGSVEDIDIVLEGDAGELASFLHERGVAETSPVTYPRFGTAMVVVNGKQVELVGARKESYDRHSRKPVTEPGTLLDDIMRRDFTINTLLENLHTGETIDLTGMAMRDIVTGSSALRRKRTARSTMTPCECFAQSGSPSGSTSQSTRTLTHAIRELAPRLGIISAERMREEFVKILMSRRCVQGMEMLRETGLLDQFAPELSAMHGVTQNIYHIYDVWSHTMKTLELIPAESGIILRMAALMHDVGKVSTRTVDEKAAVHFYNHQSVGAG